MELNTEDESGDSPWSMVSRNDSTDRIHIKELKLQENLVPNVVGMGASDALYLLESKGLKVSMNGLGRVTSQSVSPGTRITKGRSVSLTLK